MSRQAHALLHGGTRTSGLGRWAFVSHGQITVWWELNTCIILYIWYMYCSSMFVYHYIICIYNYIYTLYLHHMNLCIWYMLMNMVDAICVDVWLNYSNGIFQLISICFENQLCQYVSCLAVWSTLIFWCSLKSVLNFQLRRKNRMVCLQPRLSLEIWWNLHFVFEKTPSLCLSTFPLVDNHCATHFDTVLTQVWGLCEKDTW